MDGIINFRIIRNPLNWAIIILMVLIGGLGADIILSAITQNSEP